MKSKKFDYEESFMGVREDKHTSYRRTFKEDYRLRSLTKTVKGKKGRMLDIGCGGGILTESLPYYYPGMKIFGCDISATAISYAKKLGSGKVQYGVIKNKKFPYKNNFFDVCICFDVLEHVPDVAFFLKEIRRILKKDGQVFFIIPCEGEPFTYTWVLQKLKIGNNLTFRYLGHIHPEFTHDTVIELLKKNGFGIQRKLYSEHVFYQVLQFLVLFLPKILLETVLGEGKATEYTNSSLVTHPKTKGDPLFVLRNIWYKVWDLVMFYPMNWETRLLRNIPATAWKLHVLAFTQREKMRKK